MQRFQVAYHLKAIPEVQEYLNFAFDNSKHHGDLQDLYRRRYVHLRFRNNFISHCCPVFWSNLKTRQIHTLPAICDSSLAGRPGLNLRPHRHSESHPLFFPNVLSLLCFFRCVILFIASTQQLLCTVFCVTT